MHHLPHWRDLSKQQCLERLWDAAHDDGAFFDWVFLIDELTKERNVPAAWLDAVGEASAWDDITTDSLQFLMACATVLMNNRPSSSQLPALLTRVIDKSIDLKIIRLILWFATTRSNGLPSELAYQIRERFDNLPLWNRNVLQVFPEVRRLLKLIAEANQTGGQVKKH